MVKARKIISCEIYLDCSERDQGEVRSNRLAPVNLNLLKTHKDTQSLCVYVPQVVWYWL